MSKANFCGFLVLAGVVSIAGGCRKGTERETPVVEGAARTLNAADVVFFSEAPVSTAEFETQERRWTERVWPRFNRGRIHSYLSPEDGSRPMMAEAPPTMAFRNRGNDCGPASERRVCLLPWEELTISVCGKPLDGHVGIQGERLSDVVLMVCREITPERIEDGVAYNSERDCTKAAMVPIAKLSTANLRFVIRDTAIVAGTNETHDPGVCDSMPWVGR